MAGRITVQALFVGGEKDGLGKREVELGNVDVCFLPVGQRDPVRCLQDVACDDRPLPWNR